MEMKIKNTFLILILVVQSTFTMTSHFEFTEEEKSDKTPLELRTFNKLLEYKELCFKNFNIIKNCDSSLGIKGYLLSGKYLFFELLFYMKYRNDTSLLNSTIDKAEKSIKKLNDFLSESKEKSCKTDHKAFDEYEKDSWLGIVSNNIRRMSLDDINYAFNITLLQYILALYPKIENESSCLDLKKESDNFQKVKELCSPIQSMSEYHEKEKANFMEAVLYLTHFSFASSIKDLPCNNTIETDSLVKELKDQMDSARNNIKLRDNSS
ncbi:uncharacterized protein LOC122501886 [Leptopilina heterotoma]|uniref:uncharacterized protein LOC122501886 n=1 Tax=Leptopilina heterotoma TaxID=63436 RepID=UPI001CA99911|nr:uncharacterized protein LOC122501886 [Leptopilina heterotoma]